MKLRTLAGCLVCFALMLSAAPGKADEPRPDQTAEVSVTAGDSGSITAQAIGETTTIVGSGSVGASTFSSIRLLCPAGTVAVGGGLDPNNVLTMTVTASAPVFAENSNRLLFQPDGPNPAPIGWQASVRNETTSPLPYKVAVVCSATPGTSTIVASGSAGASSFGVTRVECPAGTAAVGGGIDPENVLTMALTSSAPTFAQNGNRLLFQPDGPNPAPVGWQASVRNETTTSKPYKVAVICTNAPNTSTVVGSGTVAGNSFDAVRVGCPAGGIAIGGGLDPNNVLTMSLTSSAPTFAQNGNRLLFQPDGTNPAPVGWQASTRNQTSSPLLYKVAAICTQPVFKVFVPIVFR